MRTPAAIIAGTSSLTSGVRRHDVLLLVAVLRAQHLVDDVAVVGEQDQALRILVEAADREDPLGVVDEVDDVAGDVPLGRAGDADRLVERDVDRSPSCAPADGSPSTRTSSPSPTCVPSSAGAPLTVTRPAAIQASASRREQTPLSLMNLLSRIGRRLCRAMPRMSSHQCGASSSMCAPKWCVTASRLSEGLI